MDKIIQLIGYYDYTKQPADFEWLLKAVLLVVAVYMLFRLFLTLLHRMDVMIK